MGFGSGEGVGLGEVGIGGCFEERYDVVPTSISSRFSRPSTSASSSMEDLGEVDLVLRGRVAVHLLGERVLLLRVDRANEGIESVRRFCIYCIGSDEEDSYVIGKYGIGKVRGVMAS